MDFKTQKKYYNLCDPYEPLAPDDPKNVDLDSLGPVRGQKWSDYLAQDIELSEDPVFLLFTGLPGSGKSTELQRLSARLADPSRLQLLPVLVNAEELLDLSNPIDTSDLMTAVLYATEREVLKLEGQDPGAAMESGYFQRLWGWLSQTDVTLKGGDFSVPSVGKLVLEMKTRPSLRQQVRQIVTAHLSTFLEQIRAEMTALNERAKKRERGGLVVIFDSLEKLRGTTTNWYDVLESAEQLFSGGAPYLKLPVHTIYTVPPALLTLVPNVRFMPMLKLRERDGSPYQPGIDAARKLVRHRIPDGVLSQMLGPQCEERVQEMIGWSGGYPREIIRLLREVLRLTQFPASEDSFLRIRAMINNEVRLLIQADDFDWLARVAVTRFLTPDNERHKVATARMLNNNVVLSYLNSDIWYDLHPSAYAIPGIQAAIEKQKPKPS